MANVVHHPHTSLEIPAGVYWIAGIGLALLLAYLSITSANNVGSLAPALTEPTLPFVPFIPMM